MYYVYILSLSNGKLYTGYSENVKRRIAEHRRGSVRTTKNCSFKLIHYEAYLLQSDAERREKFLKTTEGKRLLRRQLRDVLHHVDYNYSRVV